MIQRGLPQHVADAFMLNFQDESGLNPGINEANPTVPGSRGGFGLYQLTGPRRRGYEAFAAQRGVPAADVDAQLDYLMYELQGPEGAAARRILAAQDTPSAAIAIVQDFLRPAAEHQRSRAARYAGGATVPTGGGSYAGNAMAAPPPGASGNALAGPEMPELKLRDMRQDPAAFMTQANAFSAMPITLQRRNALGAM